MWPISARPAGAEGAVGGDVKVSLPPQLDLRDRRFQIGSGATTLVPGGAGNPGQGPAGTGPAGARAPSSGVGGGGGASGASATTSSSSASAAEPQLHAANLDSQGAAAAVALAAALHAGALSHSAAGSSASHGATSSGKPATNPAAASSLLLDRHHNPRQQKHHRQPQQQSPPRTRVTRSSSKTFGSGSGNGEGGSGSAITTATTTTTAGSPKPSAAAIGKQRQPLQSPTQKLDGAQQPAAASADRPKSSAKDRRLAKLRRRAKTMEPPVLSFYGAHPVPLPSRFATIKRRLIAGHEDAVAESWARLLAALGDEMATIRAKSSSLELMMGAIDFADIEHPERVAQFNARLKRFGVGVIRGVVPPQDCEGWVEETRRYLETKHDIKPPPPQDPTCFDFFWTPAQIRARAHPHVLRAMKFAMSLWDCESDDRMATRFPISYADRLRIHVNVHAVAASPAEPAGGSAAAPTTPTASGGNNTEAEAGAPASSSPVVQVPAVEAAAAAAATAAAAVPANQPIIAQVDGGSLERWEPDGYGRSGTYDSIFRGEWEAYDPWDPTGRITATPDLYNGAGACSIFRMFQGLLALTQVQPGMIRLLPSPKLVTAYFLLRPFFKPKTPAPASGLQEGPEWDAFLAADNWELAKEQNTIIHGAVPGHAQRVTELWHPHLDLKRTLVTPPDLQAGDYIIWHCETAYTITSAVDSRPATPGGAGDNTAASAAAAAAAAIAAAASAASAPRHERFMVYVPACPLTQTNALYLARQRKAFQRGHPGPDFDTTGTGLGTEAPHVGRLGEKEIREVGGVEGLRAMGLAPWDAGTGTPKASARSGSSSGAVSTGVGAAGGGDKMDVDSGSVVAETTEGKTEETTSGGGTASAAADGDGDAKMEVDDGDAEADKPVSSAASSASGPPIALSPAESELVRLANIILFPDKYEFYMATRHSTPDPPKA